MVKDKVALVTGGGSGIGQSTCQVLAREGAKVVVTDVNMAGAKETVKLLLGESHTSLFMDVTSNESIEAAVKTTKDRYQGPPTVCINCAGVAIRSSLLDSTDEEYNKLMAANVNGLVNTTKAVCRELVEAKLPGTIVNIASVGVKGLEDWSIYCATKGAVKSFSKSIAKEFGSEHKTIVQNMIKNVLTFKPQEINAAPLIGWSPDLVSTITVSQKEFCCCIPLKMLFGFAEDYKRIILNVKQEVVLIRASTNDNAICMSGTGTAYNLTITHLSWKIPYVHLSDEKKLELLKFVEIDRPVQIAFRRWQLNEYPSAPQTTQLIWTIKSTSQVEKPRYVIVAFQTDRRNNKLKNASNFDSCSLRNIKLYLNSQYYPYDNLNGDILLHDYYKRFQSSYYYGSNNEPAVEVSKFFANAPLCVIDCSKQSEVLKTGSVDVRLEIETSNAIPEKTTIYCLIIYDVIMEYSPLSGIVRKSM